MPKKQATMAPKVSQKDAKEDHWPQTVAKRVPKKEPEFINKTYFGSSCVQSRILTSFLSNLEAKGTRNPPEILRKTTHVSKPARK